MFYYSSLSCLAGWTGFGSSYPPNGTLNRPDNNNNNNNDETDDGDDEEFLAGGIATVRAIAS